MHGKEKNMSAGRDSEIGQDFVPQDEKLLGDKARRLRSKSASRGFVKPHVVVGDVLSIAY
jgi:hypothetical protein